MNPISYYIDYIKNIREPMDIGMSSAYEIARGVNNTNDPEAKRNGHLWCYSNDAIKEVENWLEGLNVGMNRNFQTFGSFEDLYDYAEEHIIEKKGVTWIGYLSCSVHYLVFCIPYLSRGDALFQLCGFAYGGLFYGSCQCGGMPIASGASS